MQKQVITICLIIALLEGFAGLGIEIYAIRISATYIGSSISITGVILAMVLIAIAIGYWYGGRLSQSIRTPREALLKAGFVLSLSAASHAVACIIQLPLLEAMTARIDSPILAAVGVGLLYGVGLAFGSTSIPLITQFLTLQYENKNHVDAGKNAGMMVAITTIGSVLGSTVTPILLLPYIGLMSSLALFIAALSLSATLCTWLAIYIVDSHSPNKPTKQGKSCNNYALSALAIITTIIFISINKIETGYQTATGAWFIKNIEFEGKQAVTITDKPGQSTSSCWIYETKKNCHWYGEVTVEAIEQIVPSSLVFLGGAGMAIPSEVAYHNHNSSITVIDIDKGLPNIIEAHFLKESIASNIEFVGDDARGYLNRNHDTHYDFMLIDAFQGRFVASNLYTLEALTKFKATSKFIMANIIGRPVTEHGYTQTLFKNWYEVFGESAYVITRNNSANLQNVILCNFACPNGRKLTQTDFFDNNQQVHTDDLPRLDRYYYRSIENL